MSLILYEAPTYDETEVINPCGCDGTGRARGSEEVVIILMLIKQISLCKQGTQT
jgi:hypothetical protein